MLGLPGCAGTPPELGVTDDGQLTACPASPNCVVSDAPGGDRSIAPLALAVPPQQAWQALVSHLNTQAGITIVVSEPDYLRAEARTRLLRFVDDVEFHLRPQRGLIAMRSASRIGYSDLGANRRRLDAVRAALIDSGVVTPEN